MTFETVTRLITIVDVLNYNLQSSNQSCSTEREGGGKIIQHLLVYNTTLCEPNLTDSFSARVVRNARREGETLSLETERGKKVETALLSIAPLHACFLHLFTQHH